MKSKFILLSLFTFIIITSVSLYAQTESLDTQIEYTCPMNCSDFASLEPSKCPVCGMDLKQKKTTKDPVKKEIISSSELKELMKSDEDYLILDVRTEREFNSDVKPLDSAILIPISELESRIGELEEFKNQKIIVYCLRGIRSGIGAKILNENGFDAYNLEGGLIVWYGENN